jgi:hypothetical protein
VKESAGALLRELGRIGNRYGDGSAGRKSELLDALVRRRLSGAEEVLRLHEIGCFLRAYPDDPVVLEGVETLLAGFGARGDLKRHRSALESTGIAGTRTRFRFFWPTARWIAGRWPDRLFIDWADFLNREKLLDLLPALLPYCETAALDEVDRTSREWIDTLRGPQTSDGAFLVRRFEALRTDGFERERTYDALDVPLRLEPGPDTPARGRERHPGSPVVFQNRPLRRERPDLRKEAARPPLAVNTLPRPEARGLIDLARAAMVTRSRDLDAFANADPDDVRMIECGDGLQFACLGLRPERRLMLEASYGFLTLKNGVPIGYVLASALFGSAAIAYNVFDTFRGGEAAVVYGRVLAMTRRIFGVDAFSIDPYQLGHQNAEGLGTGAWWFYYKLGFRPVDPGVKRVLRGELAKMRKNPRHRSSRSILKKLVVDDLYFFLGKPRHDVLGRIDLGNIGLAISRYLADRFGAEREAGLRTSAKEAARILGVGSMRSFTPGERLMWERWSPLILSVPGIERWSPAERRGVVRVVRAKGGRHESDFVPLFDSHRKLRRALLALASDAD